MTAQKATFCGWKRIQWGWKIKNYGVQTDENIIKIEKIFDNRDIKINRSLLEKFVINVLNTVKITSETRKNKWKKWLKQTKKFFQCD